MAHDEAPPDFQHRDGFEQAEVAGNLHLGKFEAHYEALFAEVIEDGVITAEERARLDRVADEMGLDRMRLRKLEGALQAAYEARQGVKVRELSEPPAPPIPPPSEALRASLTPLQTADDPRIAAMQRRIDALEQKVRDLEHELSVAEARVSVEVDLSDMPRATAGSHEDELEVLQRRLRHEPRDTEALHALYRVASVLGDEDRRFCVAQVLVFLGEATVDEQASFEAHRTTTLIRPSTSLTSETWRRLLFHPEEEVLTGEIYAVIVSAVLLGRVSALRRDRALPHLDPEAKQDPAHSTLQAVRCFSWAAAILGMKAPPLYADPSFEGTAEVVPGVPPATRLGRRALSGRTAQELAFVAGRHLAWYREERFVRLLVRSIADLEDLFLAALHIGNPGIPLNADVKRRVTPLAQAIEPILEPFQIDRLRGYFLRFVEEGGRTNLQRWAMAADRTAARAGLLLASDLGAARAMLDLEDVAVARDRMDDLLAFVTSDRYGSLRRQLGISCARAAPS